MSLVKVAHAKCKEIHLNIVIYTKTNCPWCVKVKELFKDMGLSFQEVLVTQKSELYSPQFGTVPQVVIDGVFIGGYEDTKKYFDFVVQKNKQRTIFNSKNTGHKTGKYPLFLGEDLGFADSINQPYPVLEKLYDTQMSFIWNHNEVDLTQDRQDMLSVERSKVNLMVYTILWQSLADSAAERVVPLLNSLVTNTALQDWYNAVALFESIHAKTYLHIIRQTFTDPNQALQEGYENFSVLTRTSLLVETFDKLLNARMDTMGEEAKRELVVLCVTVLYLLEAINFQASFAITFGIAETGVFQGIASDVKLIARDELLHAKGGSVILGILEQQWPATFERMRPTLKKMLDAIVHDEHKWSEYLFSEGRQCIGINPKIVNEYVNWLAIPVAKTLGVEAPYKVDKNPLPYMDNYVDSSKIQVAAQEMQLTNYLVAAVKRSTKEDIDSALTKLRGEYD